MNQPAEKREQTKEQKKEKFFLFEKTAIIGFFLSLVGIYTAILPFELGISLIPADSLSFIAGIGMIFAIIWAADAVRKISKYGLGTGVPSVGMFGIGTAIIVALFAVFLNSVWNILIGAVLSLIIGWICGKLINNILKMNIPAMEKRIAEITTGCTIAVLASFVVVAGSADIDLIHSGYVFSGVIALGFIGISVAVFHAYNANLGPDEMPDRTKMLTILDSSMILMIFGITALFLKATDGLTIQTAIGPIVTIFISIVFILISYYKFWIYVKRDAWQIESTGLLPSEEDLN